MDLRDFVALEKSEPSPEFVSITCERLCIWELERTAEHLAVECPSGYRLLEAVKCLHLAMVAGMSAALNGSAGIGALPIKQRAKAIAALEAGRYDDISEHMMSYPQLLSAIQSDAALALSLDEQRECKVLNDLRERIDHPKPSTFIEARRTVRQCIRTVVPIVPRLMTYVFHHFEDEDIMQAQATVSRIVLLTSKDTN